MTELETSKKYKELRWGILATGLIAGVQTTDLLTDGSKVTAVGSRSLESARKFAAEYGIPHSYGSYEELCNSPEVDVIYIASPHSFHCEHALLAIAGGKHVLVEKAFTLNAREACNIFEAARAKGLFVMEAMWTRFLPSMREILATIQRGEIGEPRLIIADHTQFLPPERSPRLHEPELGGSALLDLGVYIISLAHFVLGKETLIQASARLNDKGVDTTLGMIFDYENGAQAVLSTSSMVQGTNTAVIIGETGRIEIDPVWYNHTSFSQYNRAGDLQQRYTEKIIGRGMQYQTQEVEACIAQGQSQSSLISPEHSLSIMHTMDTVRRHIGVSYPCDSE